MAIWYRPGRRNSMIYNSLACIGLSREGADLVTKCLGSVCSMVMVQ